MILKQSRAHPVLPDNGLSLAEQTARDVLLFQTDSAEELDNDNVLKYGLAFEQWEKVEQMMCQAGGVRQEQERVVRLDEKVKHLELQKGARRRGVGHVPGAGMKAGAQGWT